MWYGSTEAEENHTLDLAVLRLLVLGVLHSKGAESIVTTELKKQSADETAGSRSISAASDDGSMMDR